MTPVLPRPLKAGEFYCHQCQKFVPMEQHSDHWKLHNQIAKKEQQSK